MTVIDMQTMRYINLLDRAANVKTKNCFLYNNTVIFAVPGAMISKAIGPDAINIRRIQESLGKKVRIIKEPAGLGESERFISDIVYPVNFKGVELKDGVFLLNAGSQSKAALIGRNKRRLEELRKISQDVFGFDLKIV